MKTACLIIAVLLSSVSFGQDEPTAEAIRQLREDNARLIELVQTLSERLNRMEQISGEEVPPVPEIEVMQRIPGQHVLHPQVSVPVYARSQWISYYKGRSKVYELIQDGVRIVPVGAVVYEAGNKPPEPKPAPSSQPQSAGPQVFIGGQQR